MLRNYFGGGSRRFARSVSASADGVVVVAAIRSSPSHGYFGQYWPLRRQADWKSIERMPLLGINGIDQGRLRARCLVVVPRGELRLTVGPTTLLENGIPTATGELAFDVPGEIASRAEVLQFDIRPLRVGDKTEFVPAMVTVSARFGPPGTRLRRVQPMESCPAAGPPIDPVIRGHGDNSPGQANVSD